jgi:hypothetical protein
MKEHVGRKWRITARCTSGESRQGALVETWQDALSQGI